MHRPNYASRVPAAQRPRGGRVEDERLVTRAIITEVASRRQADANCLENGA